MGRAPPLVRFLVALAFVGGHGTVSAYICGPRHWRRPHAYELRSAYDAIGVAAPENEALRRTEARSVGGPVRPSGTSDNNVATAEVERNEVVQRALGAGTPHTAESRAKISVANKGKVPWNKGVRHSWETRQKIAEATKRAMLKRKIALLAEQGTTLEEYEEQRRIETEKKGEKSSKNYVCTPETRAKISWRLKQRWTDPEYREKRLAQIPKRRGMTHTDETKDKIRRKMAALWQSAGYRDTMRAKQRDPETKARIAETLRQLWRDPDFRAEKLARIATRSEDHKRRISESLRAKWADPEYRNRICSARAAKSEVKREGRKRGALVLEGSLQNQSPVFAEARKVKPASRRSVAAAVRGSAILREEERRAMELWLAQGKELQREQQEGLVAPIAVPEQEEDLRRAVEPRLATNLQSSRRLYEEDIRDSSETDDLGAAFSTLDSLLGLGAGRDRSRAKDKSPPDPVSFVAAQLADRTDGAPAGPNANRVTPWALIAGKPAKDGAGREAEERRAAESIATGRGDRGSVATADGGSNGFEMVFENGRLIMKMK